MRAALAITLKDLRLRLRDRSAIVLAFIAPVGLALIVTFAFGSGFSGNFEASYAVLDADNSELSRGFTKQVLGAPQLRDQITAFDARSENEARRLIRRDVIAAAFLIPEDFSEAVTGNRKAAITVLRNPNAPVGSEVAEALARAYTQQINAGRLAVVTTVRAGGGATDPARIGELARATATERIPVRLVDGNIGVRDVSGANYFGPAMAIFFLFFTTSFAARSLLAEREQGTLPRVLAAPISRASLLAGKGLTGFLMGSATLVVMFATFTLLLDVEWGDPFALVVLSGVTVLAVMGVSAAVQILARTQEQADAYSSVVAVTLSLLGGNFFPLFQMPEAIQRISLVTPNGWAIRGFTDIGYDGASLGDIGTNVSVIAGFAVVTTTLALLRARSLTVR